VDELNIVSRIQKALKRSVDDISATMISGGVDNMEKYKYLLGQAVAYQITLQEISNLLNKKEQQDEQGNVIDFGNKD
jgi:hypothetical protein|tara:strand:- start:226 stop:456 length:231 start_codon:yes stop_codon:yes gene_type:complete